MDKFIGIITGRVYRRMGICAALLCMAGNAFAQDEWANLPDPTRPSNPWAAVKATVAKTKRSANLSLESTIVSRDRRLAIINGKTLGIGDLIDGARITNITPYKVVLHKSGRIVSLVLVSDKLIKSRDPEVIHR